MRKAIGGNRCGKDGSMTELVGMKLKMDNGSTIEFKKYGAGMESFQGPDKQFLWMIDGPEYYKWWQMPLFWGRVLIYLLRRFFGYE